jgi:hypothetical protein
VAVTVILPGPFGVALGEVPLAPPDLEDVQLTRLRAITANNNSDKYPGRLRAAMGLRLYNAKNARSIAPMRPTR